MSHTEGLIYVHLPVQCNQRFRQTAYSSRCVSAFYVVFIKPEPRRVISALLHSNVISEPLKEGRMCVPVPATMDDELKF